MKVTNTAIEGLKIISPKVFGDKRGYFFEAYNKDKFLSEGIDDIFVQDNISKSSKGVLRGLHFQNPPYSQGKLVSVLQGAVLDVALDIRSESPTYGKHFSIVLSEENKTQFYIPSGFAHGFLTLEDNTIFSYKCTQLYNKESEESIHWADPTLNIQWEIQNPIVSEKDQLAQSFNSFKSGF